MKIIYIFFLVFFFNNAFTYSTGCFFEEIYQSGETQQGKLIIREEKMRYEYFDKNLFTIIYNNQKLFQISNSNREKIQIIQNHNNIIPLIMNIYSQGPDYKKIYKKDGYTINLENSSNNFLKRISITSNQLNVSIYLLDCQKIDADDKYFNFNPFEEYVLN